MKIIEIENMDTLSDNESLFKGYDYYYCCLGSRVGKGKDIFVKVDHDYPIKFAQFAKADNAKRYSFVSSGGANKNSWFLYMKTKGKCEESIKALGITNVTIARPGLLLQREADFRIGEKVISFIPFIPKITCLNIGKALIENSIASIEENEVLENRDLLERARKSEL